MTATAPHASSDVPVDAPLLRVEHLAVTHDGEHAPTPADASFSVARGEVVLVLGPSGAGKSTLALALNGLIPHDVPAEVAGVVSIAGLPAASTPVARLSTVVGMVFQDPDAQLVTGTILDEVAFGPENLRMPVAEVLARSEAALRTVGLWERRRENPDVLSGGGRQRLAIACVLALGSALMVLDEPTANLDPIGIEDVYEALAQIAAHGDRAIVLIEHNLDAAIDVVTRVVALDATGRTVADGPVDAVLRERADELHALGVWLPTSTIAALRLRRAGYRLDPLPLTPGELRDALESSAPPASHAPSPASSPDAGRDATAVRVRGLTVRRGGTVVLESVDLDVPTGSFTAIVGANGSGKTSLIQAIAGVVRPPRGAVSLGGVDPARTDPRTLARQVGFVFQNPEHQFISHTVHDELAHGLRLQRLPEDEVRIRTDAVLERLGLTAKAHVHPFLLSGGQKRRLSVGTALIAGAPLLLLDEPTFGQDRARADQLLGLLEELNQQGTTVVIVTHDMQLVTEYADRTIVLGDGRLLAADATAAVFDDAELVARAGLRLPPLRQALHGLTAHTDLAKVTRWRDLPGGAR
ncbi:DUF3744 domain-containing protein [Microbacterium awajiense]|uniref:DUF3744 domain-containing protein n=1 Tax=Microbacterium awajiense TaxID=415214 RepID=A0ABP7AN80_9MICO